MSGYNPLKWQQQQVPSPGAHAPQQAVAAIPPQLGAPQISAALAGIGAHVATGVAAKPQQAHGDHAVGVAQGQGGMPPLPQHAQHAAGAEAAANGSGVRQLPGVAGLLLARAGTPHLQQAAALGQQQPAPPPAPTPAAPQSAGIVERRASRGLPPGLAQQPHPQPQPLTQQFQPHPQPQPQPQQRSQQPQPQPRPSLQQWLAKLQREAVRGPGATPAAFCEKEAVRWLHAYAPGAHALLQGDSRLRAYMPYIRSTHGPGVLACVLFFTLGHHAEFKGASVGLRLETADNPGAVLNQRCSFYRLLLSNCPAKADALASVIVHRPDVACQLCDDTLRRLFGQPPRSAQATHVPKTLSDPSIAGDLSPLAAMLALPHGWEATCTGASCAPREWLSSYVAAAMQDVTNADRMAAFVAKRAAAQQQLAPQQQPAQQQQQQQQQPAKQPAHAHDPWQPAAPSSSSSSRPPPAAQPQPQSPQPPAASDKAGPVTELALVQLQLERPDVVACASKALRDEIAAMPWQRALSAIGALSDLPKDWEALMTPAQRTAHLSAVVERTAAHSTQQAPSPSEADAAWQQARSSPAGGQGRVASASSRGSAGGGNGAAKPPGSSGAKRLAVRSTEELVKFFSHTDCRFSSVEQAEAFLRRERPEVWAALDEGNQAMLAAIPPLHRLQVLEVLADMDLDRANNKAGYLQRMLKRAMMAYRFAPCKALTSGLAALQAGHGDVFAKIDRAAILYLAGLQPDQVPTAIQALVEADAEQRNEYTEACSQRWLLDRMQRALRAKFG